MTTVPFKGVATAVITPMKEDKIDYDGFERLLEMQAEGGIGAVVICGTTGESPTLSEGEKLQLFRFAADGFGKKMKIIAGCGSPSTVSTASLAEKAETLGVNGILTVTPYYNKCSTEGLYLHYKAVAERVSLPVIAYNVPPRTGFDIPLDAYERMAEIDNLIAVKEASGSVTKAEQIISRYGDRFALYSGCDELIAPLYAIGARGVISVVSNILPRETERLCRLLSEGDIKSASRLQLKLFPLIRALFSEVSPIPVKYALSRLGICQNYLRLPLTPATAATMRLIDTELERFI